MRIFKQEQMFMVDEYYQLKQRDAKKEKSIYKLEKTIKRQERIISDLVCFMHECLDQIFDKALSKQDLIVKSMKLMGQTVRKDDKNDPFKLYQGYLDVVKPIDYETNK